jgi:hypothetical protein
MLNGVCDKCGAEVVYQLTGYGPKLGVLGQMRIAHLVCCECGYLETYCVGDDLPRVAEHGMLVEARQR